MQSLRVSNTVEGGTTGASALLRVDGLSVGGAVRHWNHARVAWA